MWNLYISLNPKSKQKVTSVYKYDYTVKQKVMERNKGILPDLWYKSQNLSFMNCVGDSKENLY